MGADVESLLMLRHRHPAESVIQESTAKILLRSGYAIAESKSGSEDEFQNACYDKQSNQKNNTDDPQQDFHFVPSKTENGDLYTMEIA